MQPQHTRQEPQEETQVQVRVHPGEGPALIYLPGLHGDWTLVGSFRKALNGRLRLVEITYPRTLTWSLDDYARNIEAALGKLGIRSGWLLGESFGSQVAWALTRCPGFKIEGIVLAGGFVRHPALWGVRAAEWVGGSIPLCLIVAVLFGYSRIARFRFRKAPDVAKGLDEFIARRTELDRKAAVHRLRLIFQNDARATVCNLRLPLYVVAGFIDPVVPWFCVRKWLRENCSALREYRLMKGADHNVLGTAPKASADLVVGWVTGRQ